MPNVTTVNTIDDLKNTAVAPDAVCEVKGYYAVGDGGGGTFYWVPSTSETANGGTLIESTANPGGLWKRTDPENLTARRFGAKGDGQTADGARLKAAFAYAITSGFTLRIEEGDYWTKGFTALPVTDDLKIVFEEGGRLFVGSHNGVAGNQVALNGSTIATPGIGSAVARNSRTIHLTSVEHIQKGDIICLNNTEAVETAWSTKKSYTSVVLDVMSGNQVVVAHPVNFDYPASSATTVKIYRSGSLTFENFSLLGNLIAGTGNVFITGIKDINIIGGSIDSTDTTLPSSVGGPQAVVMHDVVNVSVSDININRGTYSFSIARSRNVFFENIMANSCRHPIAPTGWTEDVYVNGLVTYNCWSGIDAHPSINVNYNSVITNNDLNFSNLRCLGGSITNSKLHTIAAADENNMALFHTLELTASYKHLYNEYDLLFENVEWLGASGVGARYGRSAIFRNVRTNLLYVSDTTLPNTVKNVVLDGVFYQTLVMNLRTDIQVQGREAVVVPASTTQEYVIDLKQLVPTPQEKVLHTRGIIFVDQAGANLVTTLKFLDDYKRKPGKFSFIKGILKLKCFTRGTTGLHVMKEKWFAFTHVLVTGSEKIVFSPDPIYVGGTTDGDPAVGNDFTVSNVTQSAAEPVHFSMTATFTTPTQLVGPHHTLAYEPELYS